MPGWDSRLEPGLAVGASLVPGAADAVATSGKVLRITTPTGHEYTSVAPSLRDAAV